MTQRRLRLAALVAGQLIVVAAVGAAAITLAHDFDAVRASVSDLSIGRLIAAFALALGSVALLAQRWGASLAALGERRAAGDVLAWFAVGQIGKYVPGGVWQVVGQGELARRAGVPRRSAYGSVALSTMSLVGGAAVVTLAAETAGIIGGVDWWVVAVGVGAAVVVALPPVRRRVLGALGHEPAGRTLRLASLARLAAASLPAWAVIGAATALVASAFGASASSATVASAAVASWLVGILTIPAPGGIGAREAILVALLSGQLTVTEATVVAVGARLVFVVADAAWFAAARVWLSASARRAASSTAVG